MLLWGKCQAQSTVRPADTKAWADNAWLALERNVAREPAATIDLTARLLAVYAAERDACKVGQIAAIRSMSLEQVGQLDSALACAQRSIAGFRAGCDSLGLMRGYLAMVNLHLTFGDLHKADSLAAFALRGWNDAWGGSAIKSALLTDQAIAHANQGKLQDALVSFRAVLSIALENDNEEDIDGAYTNLGVLKGMLGEMDSSEYFNRAAYMAALRKGNQENMARQLGNLAVLAMERKDYRKALVLLDSADKSVKATKDLRLHMVQEGYLEDVYSRMGDYANAHAHLKEHLHLKDSLLNIEKVRALTEMQEKYESEKKAKEIKELQVQKLDSDLNTEKALRTKNIYLFTGLGVLGLAAGLWNRLRYTRKSRTAIQKEKDISEGLLLNILPEEVAAELKAKGYADAKEFDHATILFTDFKGFTELSEKLTADELIKELNICFKAFDGIMGQYRVEKIKTIGDAYMAAGGLPDATHGLPGDVVEAALDMQAFMRSYGEERRAQGRPYFTMRVGVHTGPVIAGIVGVKKFAYDIWGDTVNTASRMESSGEVGRVNISNATYLLVKDDPRFTFTSRGMVAAKGKGELEMWFAERKAT